MRIFYTFTILFCFAINPAFAQKIINGSFEGKSSVVPCNGILIDQYDEDMNGTGCSFGDTLISTGVPSIWYLDKNCGEGQPHQGKTFIGICAANNKSDKISMQLDTTTINWYGRQYKLKYWFKKPVASSAIKIVIGASFDCNSFGTAIDSITAPTDTTWRSDSLNVLPPAGTRYLTVMGFNSGGTKMWTLIDDFSLTPDIVGVNDVNSNNNIGIYPNPFTSSTGITLPENVQLPCNITISDVTGRIVQRYDGINTRQVTINRGDMNTGLYILRMTDSENNLATSRLVVQ